MLIQAGTASMFSTPFFDERRGGQPQPPRAQANEGSAAQTTQQHSQPFIVRRVGLVAGTFNVFVDLVSQTPRELVSARLFGPQDRSGRSLLSVSPQPSLTVLA